VSVAGGNGTGVGLGGAGVGVGTAKGPGVGAGNSATAVGQGGNATATGGSNVNNIIVQGGGNGGRPGGHGGNGNGGGGSGGGFGSGDGGAGMMGAIGQLASAFAPTAADPGLPASVPAYAPGPAYPPAPAYPVGGPAIAPSLAPTPLLAGATPGFRAIALGWNGGGGWVVRTSPTLAAAGAAALQTCNSQFGSCTLSDVMVAPTTFGCLVVAQGEDASRVFAGAGDSVDTARAAVDTQVVGAGIRGEIVYTACNS
jgi:hypothetical protein